MAIILVTGPSRSGKSEWAEQLAEHLATTQNQQVIYVATAQTNPHDGEWQARIAQHQERRPKHWQCQEVPTNLAAAIAGSSHNPNNQNHCLLIDSLGTWLANLIEESDAAWAQQQQLLLEALRQTTATVILVAEETGWGIVPAYPLGRQFRDRLGTLSRAVGTLADDVYLVTSGFALNLTQLGTPVPFISDLSHQQHDR